MLTVTWSCVEGQEKQTEQWQLYISILDLNKYTKDDIDRIPGLPGSNKNCDPHSNNDSRNLPAWKAHYPAQCAARSERPQ